MKKLLSAAALTLGLLAGCGGGGGANTGPEGNGDTPPKPLSASVSPDVQVLNDNTVISAQPSVAIPGGPSTGNVAVTLVAGTNVSVGQVVVLPPPAGSDALMPITGRVVSVSAAPGEPVSAVIEAVSLPEVFDKIDVNLNSAQDFKLVKVAMIGQTTKQPSSRRSKILAESGQEEKETYPKFTIKQDSELKDNNDGEGINGSLKFEIEIKKDVKVTGVIEITNLRQETKIDQLTTGGASHAKYNNRLVGGWRIAIDYDTELEYDFYEAFQKKQCEFWDSLVHDLGIVKVSGLKCEDDKKGLFPIAGFVLASTATTPGIPFKSNDPLIENLLKTPGAHVAGFIYAKLGGNIKLSGKGSIIEAKGEINQAINMEANGTDAEDMTGTIDVGEPASEHPGLVRSTFEGELKTEGQLGVAVSADLFILGVRPMSVTAEFGSMMNASLIGKAEIIYFPAFDFSSTMCYNAGVNVYGSVAVKAKLGIEVSLLGGTVNYDSENRLTVEKEIIFKEWEFGSEECAIFGAPILAVTEIGPGTGESEGKIQVQFDATGTPPFLSEKTDTWMIIFYKYTGGIPLPMFETILGIPLPKTQSAEESLHKYPTAAHPVARLVFRANSHRYGCELARRRPVLPTHRAFRPPFQTVLASIG
ncbi:MAG: hypothetical protein LBV49_12910, partial [Azonexus sp.]|nr:hypothetical protein [Azonexus sp.]